MTNRKFVVLGALNELAPTLELLKRGGTVFAIDESEGKQADWAVLMEHAEQTCGTLIVPRIGMQFGVNLVEHVRGIGQFIIQDQDALIFFNALDPCEPNSFMKFAVADCLTEFICCKINETAVCAWDSPSQICCVSLKDGETSSVKYDDRPSWIKAWTNLDKTKFIQNTTERIIERKIGGGRVPLGSTITSQGHLGRANADLKEFYMQNGIICQDSPGKDQMLINRLIVRWRIIVARAIGTHQWLSDKRRHRVSATMLPQVSTHRIAPESFLLLASMRGKERFGIALFDAQTVVEIGTLLLIRDLKDPYSPSNPTQQLNNSMELFLDSAIHGGVFTCAYTADSIAAASAFLYVGERVLAVVAVVGAVALAGVAML